MNRYSEGSRVAFSTHTAFARPLCLTFKALALLLLLGALLAVFAPMPAWAQFVHTQITSSTAGGNSEPSINADGTRIAFYSNRDLTGGNADGNYEIFLWTQGSGFTQITNSTGGGVFSYFRPSINSDGTKIAFESNRDLTPGSPGNADGNWEIFLWTQGSGISQITNSTAGHNYDPSINADGTRIAFYSNGDLTGGNADGSYEIFLWTQGSGITQITSSSDWRIPSINASINADGTRIAFRSSSDLTGGNADGNWEIFLAGSPSADTTPDPFTFTDLTGVALSTVQTSNAVTVSGITAPAAIAIVGGAYERNGSGIWSSSAGTVANGDTVRVRHTSAATNSTAVHTTLTIGGVSDTFTSTTLTVSNGPDLTGVWSPVSQFCHRNRCILQGSVTVWNQGNATAPTSRLRVILSDDPVLDPGDTVLQESSIGQLQPGQDRTRPVNEPLPLGVNASGKYLFAVVDALNSVAETDETNNEPMYGPIP